MEINNENLKISLDLMKRNCDLMSKGIVITFFSYKIEDKETKKMKLLFRFYFKDLFNDFIHNPTVENEKGKKTFKLYEKISVGLLDHIEAAEEYLLNKK